jgi:cytochrome c peroxidase
LQFRSDEVFSTTINNNQERCDMMMKKMMVTAAILFAAMAGFGGYATAAETTSVEYGKKLFGDPSLGGPGSIQSCNTCHPSGKGLQNAWKNVKLSEKINNCIGAMKGKALPMDSREMRSLVLYIQSLKPTSTKY